jgi:hypothetical protein
MPQRKHLFLLHFSKTLPMLTEANFPRRVNVLGRFSLAGFEVITHGRFRVIAGGKLLKGLVAEAGFEPAPLGYGDLKTPI